MIHFLGRDWSLAETAMMLVGTATIVAIIANEFSPANRQKTSTQGSLLSLSLRVLRQDPETLVFALASVALMFLPFALLAWAASSPEGMARVGAVGFWVGAKARDLPPGALEPRAQAEGLLAVFGLAFCFFSAGGLLSAAVLGCAMKRLRGEDPTLYDGALTMVRVAPRLIAWALIAAGVKTILLALARKFESFRPYAFLSHVAWDVANTFSLPIMVAEDVGPLEAIRRSQELVQRGFLNAFKLELAGEGFGVLLGVTGVVSWVIGLVAALTGPMDSVLGVMGPMFGLPLLMVMVVGACCSTLYLILLAAVYLRASEAAGGARSRVRDFFGSRV